jgi:alpha-beta hydrolase superfamily lysophospholipase
MTSASRSASWGREILLRLTVASGVGYIATSYTVSRWLTRRSPGMPQPPPLPEVALEPLRCRTEDRLWLQGWVFTPPSPVGTVALFHGLRGNRMQMLSRVAFLTGAGYRCVTFDHRAHGQSQGRRSSFGFHERCDVQAIAELIAGRWPDQPAAALGLSMGAAAICFAATGIPFFQAFILESLYHDLAAAYFSRVGARYPAWFKRFRRGIVWVTERRLGLRLEQVAPVGRIRDLSPRPVLLVTGSEDRYAPPEDLHRLFERCAEPRELCVVPGASHMDVCEKGGESYRENVLAFLQRRLAG